MSGEHRTVEVNKAIIVNLPKIRTKDSPEFLVSKVGVLMTSYLPGWENAKQ